MMDKREAVWTIGLGMSGFVLLGALLRGTPNETESPRKLPAPGVGRLRERPEERSPLRAAIPSLAAAESVPPGQVEAETKPAGILGELPDLASRRALRHAEQDFWDDLGTLLDVRSKVEPAKYRETVSALTAEYLGLDPSRRSAFDETSAQATEEIAQAWKIRNEAIVAVPEGLSAEARAEEERQIQERYEQAKAQASSRVESLLGDSPRHEHFRLKLGEWIDAVR
jgi:hypothetical protein